jgi:hypothetical protein
MDAASKLEFCKSRHGEAIICHCSLLQSAHPSLSTSIVELQASDGSKEVQNAIYPTRHQGKSHNQLDQPQLLTATATISLFCCTVALAESNTPPRQQIIKSSHNLPKAPGWQRQQTPRDISAAKGSDENGLLGDDAFDKALDSRIKSICRGCSSRVDKSRL